MNTFRITAGVALASMIVSTNANAQQPLGAPAGTTAVPLSNAPLGRALEDRVLVRGGDPEAIGRRTTPPPAARYLGYTDEHTEITRQQWIDRGWPEEQFDTRRRQNYRMCTRTTVYNLRTADAIRRQENRRPGLENVGARFLALAGSIETASRGRHAGNALSVISGGVGGFMVAGPGGAIASGGGALGNAIASETAGRAWDQSMLVSRDGGLLWTDAMIDHGEAMILYLEILTDYLEMTQDYCNEFLSAIPAQAASNYTLDPNRQSAYGNQNVRVGNREPASPPQQRERRRAASDLPIMPGYRTRVQ
ncbi:MAG: hypothetical protein QOE22_10 [Candidatus Parcubacteria bacterium]|jgi:hypothetical protein|nr:hypothetical protein [Candidatus Parcubacteria bacterium]